MSDIIQNKPQVIQSDSFSYVANGKLKKLNSNVIGNMYEEGGLFYEPAKTFGELYKKPVIEKIKPMLLDSIKLRHVSMGMKGKLEEDLNYKTPNRVDIRDLNHWQAEYDKIIAELDRILKEMREGRGKVLDLRSVSYIISQLEWCTHVFHGLKREHEVRQTSAARKAEEEEKAKQLGINLEDKKGIV